MRFPEGQWPVSQEDLDGTIREVTEERGLRVLSVSEAMRRGPLPLYAVDDEGRGVTDEDGNPVLQAEIAQLYAYVDVA